jgi:hypothetical protein
MAPVEARLVERRERQAPWSSELASLLAVFSTNQDVEPFLARSHVPGDSAGIQCGRPSGDIATFD